MTLINDPKRRYSRHIGVPPSNRRRLLDGVVIPRASDQVVCSTCEYGGTWYQTSHTTPYLYLPPIETYATGEAITPHMSIDVLVTVRTPGDALIMLTGWFNYNIYQWQYYAVDPRDFDVYTPQYWRFMPLGMPPGWVTSPIDAEATDRLHNRSATNETPS